jgi:uncharacterized membrane protein YbhN (UPF0104 family)
MGDIKINPVFALLLGAGYGLSYPLRLIRWTTASKNRRSLKPPRVFGG